MLDSCPRTASRGFYGWRMNNPLVSFSTLMLLVTSVASLLGPSADQWGRASLRAGAMARGVGVATA